MDTRILVGNFLGYPGIFKEYLKRFEYQMDYDYEKSTLSFSVMHPHAQGGNTVLFQLQMVPYETATKFAKLLDLEPYNREYDPCRWKSRIPMVLVWHTGNEDADKVIIELVKLDLPYFIFPDCKVLGVSFGEAHEYWKEGEAQVAEIIDAIRTFAVKYGKLKEEVA